MTVRVARQGDEGSILRLVAQLGHAIPLDDAAYRSTIASYLAGEHSSVILQVVEEDGVVHGYALTTVVPLLSTNGPSAQLQEIVVDSEVRGHDYGTQLVHAVEAECVARGVTQLTVASRRAGGFYDRLGFHESAEYMRKLL